MFRAFNTKQNKAVFHAIAAVPLGPVGIAITQTHQGSSILASDVTEIHESSILHLAISSNSPGDKSKVLPALSSSAHQPRLNIFSQNVAPPALSATFPPPGVRFENTAQLAYCSNLLRDCMSRSLSATSTFDAGSNTVQQALIEPYVQSEDERSHIRSLIRRVVEEFVTDSLKTTAVLSEVLLLAPSLDQELYRKLLNCVITEFETARLLDLALLQGLVQLVENASSDYLEPDDLVRILVVLRTRLQNTHQQSTKHPYYLTWALSRLLDAMVEGKVKDLPRVVDQEPLSALFNQLKDSEDPYLKSQATYAFQGLLHVPNDETRRQCMLRYAGDITMGLLGVASVCKLDLGQLKDGADHLYNVAGDVHEVGTKVTGGVQSLFESGQGVWASVKGGIFSGGRQLWYTSLREAQQHIRNGRLQDFNNLVFEAPCRDHIDFQWGICRLLAGIAADPLWETSTRQQAIDFLAELYRADSIWTPSKGIYRWILDILHIVRALKDTTISDHALLLLQSLKSAGDAAKQELYQDTTASPLCSYPIQACLPIPTSSTLLLRVLAIPPVEYDLFRLKNLRLKEQQSALYIQPQAKPSLHSSDDTLFPLMEKALEFLSGPGRVFLLLGDSGGGKSTFNLQLERTLWKSYKNGGPIPLHINLPSIENPQQDMIGKQLKQLFTETQIIELKRSREFIVICDGYDESQLMSNIYTSNQFNQPGQYSVKMIITCRTQYLGPDYRNRFMPHENSAYHRVAPDLFQEAIIAPFTREQIEQYVDIYVPLEPRTWVTKDYMDRLTAIPNLMDLVKNPFLLSLALEALPGFTKGKKDLLAIKVTRVQLYDMFVQHWLEVNQRRLEASNSTLSNDDKSMLIQLVDAGFVSLGIEYSTKVAQAIFDKQDGKPEVQYVQLKDKNTWKAEFFGSQPEVRLLRDSSPLTRTGNRFRFLHRSMQEYFYSRLIYNPARIDEGCDPQVESTSSDPQILDADGPLFRRSLVQEPSIIQFLCDRVDLDLSFKHQLRDVIDRSKVDVGAAIAAANAISILVKAGVSFNGASFQGINIRGADLSNGNFDSVQFQGANLMGVNFSKSWLRQVDMSNACMEGVRFGELPYLEMDTFVSSCAYSPDGKMLGAALHNGIIYIYDTSTWTKMHRLEGHGTMVTNISFSSDSQRLVSGSYDMKVRLWDTTNGEEVLVMEGHSDGVISATISPCGNRIASSSDDKTARLWDAKTGEELLKLEGHTDSVVSVKYSPDGRWLVSGSLDRTIRFWDSETGEPGSVLSPSGRVSSLVYSSDGRWLVAGYLSGQLQYWDTVSLEPRPVLSHHSDNVTGIDFHPDGQWIASSSIDRTVKVWDASTNTLLAVLIGHYGSVNCISASPDGRQIASGGNDRRVRLWEVDISRSGFDLPSDKYLKGLAYSRCGQFLLSYDTDGVFRQWDAAAGISTVIPFKLTEMPEQGVKRESGTFALGGSQFAFGYSDGSIRLRNCQTGTAGPVLEGHSKSIKMLVFSPCCRWIVSADASNTVQLWDLSDQEIQRPSIDFGEVLEGYVGSMAFSSTSGQFAISTSGSIIYLFDTQSRVCQGRMRLEGSILTSVYSPNDQQIASGTEEGKIHLWDLQSEEPGAKLEGHQNWVRCIAYSPCGQWIASGSDDWTVGIWHRQSSDEVESWSRVHSICAFFGYVCNVAWNPVFPMELVTSAKDGTVRVWRMSISESGNVIFKMVWGPNLGLLYTEGVTFTNAVGLNPINQRLLLQRGAVHPSGRPRSSQG